MKLKQAIADKTYDVRTLEKLRSKQLIEESAYQNHLSSIEDMSDHFEYVEIDPVESPVAEEPAREPNSAAVAQDTGPNGEQAPASNSWGQNPGSDFNSGGQGY